MMSRRVVPAIAASAMSHGIAAISALALVPLFLRAWGVAEYGLWLTVTAAVSYLALLDFGSQTFVANLLAAQHARDERAAFRDTLSRTLSLSLVLSGTALVAVIGGLAAARLIRLPFVGRPLEGAEAVLIALLAAHALLAVPAGVYATVYRATGRFTKGATIGNAGRVLGLAVSVVLLMLGASPVWYAAGLVATAVLVTAIIVLDTQRTIPAATRIRLSLSEAQSGLAYAGAAVRFWVLGLSQTLSTQGLLAIIAIVSGSTAVAGYATHRTLAAVSAYAALVVQAPLLPELTGMWARGEDGRLAQVSSALIRRVVAVTGSIAVTLWVLAPAVFHVWTSGRIAFDPWLFAILLVQGVISSGSNTATWPLLAANGHERLVRWSLANAVAVLLLAVPLTLMDPRGPALATLAGDLVFGLMLLPRLSASFLRVGTFGVYRDMLAGATLPAAAVVLVVLLAQPAAYPQWAAAGAMLAGMGAWASAGRIFPVIAPYRPRSQ